MTTRYQNNTHARYLTFGCFRRKHLFVHHELADRFVRMLDQWRSQNDIKLWAYVVMPSHVHLLLYDQGADLGKSLSSLKRSFGLDAMEWISQFLPNTYQDLEAKDHGQTMHRFWQAGGGYDRNVFTDDAVLKAMQYIHNNPVKAGIVRRPEEYKWSSAKFWLEDRPDPIRLDIPEWWSSEGDKWSIGYTTT